jgi:pimeloyl-ACP methyl ester carboxylesterase
LVLLSGYYYPSLRADVLTAGPAIPLVGDLMRYTVSPLVARMLWRPLTKRVFSPMVVDTRFRKLPVWMMLRPKQLRASAAETAMMIPSAMSLAKRYPELKVPAIVISGTKDKVVDYGHNSERLSERLCDSELRPQSGVGHMVHYAQPDEVMAAIDAISSQVGSHPHLPTAQEQARAWASESGT